MATTPFPLPPAWLLALQARGVQVVGEVKPHSPFSPSWPPKRDRVETLLWLDSWCDVISVHTDEHWGGCYAWLAQAKLITTKPILAKGFHPTQAHVDRAFGCGADFVLTVGWWNGDPRCWHEVETESQLLEAWAPRVVWNARDPRTGIGRGHQRDIVESRRTMGHLKRDTWLCQASSIRSPSDVHPHADAVLIGEALN